MLTAKALIPSKVHLDWCVDARLVYAATATDNTWQPRLDAYVEYKNTGTEKSVSENVYSDVKSALNSPCQSWPVVSKGNR